MLEDLGPLVKKAAAARPKDLSLLHAPVSDAQQEKLASEVLDFLKADRDRLAISTTEHPFTDFLSHDDVRITTHYEPDQFVSSILSTVHEYGHALYHLQTEAAFDKTMLVEGVGCAAHESQSRLLENHIGRSRAFWSVLLPALRKEIPALETVDADTLFTLVNTCRPSLIRTDADELTYPFHILIRYEIERKWPQAPSIMRRFRSSGTIFTKRISAHDPKTTVKASCRMCTGLPAISAISPATRLALPTRPRFMKPWSGTSIQSSSFWKTALKTSRPGWKRTSIAMAPRKPCWKLSKKSAANRLIRTFIPACLRKIRASAGRSGRRLRSN
ncbi:hypothetical protein KWG61_01290 [Allobaculum sp. Allo2]|nr:hypothetical protein KWG61_01290 [Allobaculum sp. Allo2]